MTTLNDVQITNGQTSDVSQLNKLLGGVFRSEFNNAENLSATRVLLDADMPIQRFNCNGADRTASLPTPNTTTNHPFLIKNETASGHYNLTITNSSGSNALCVVPPGEYAFLLPDGSGVWTVVNRAFNRPLTTGQITSNQNDWYPGGADYSDVIRTYSDAARDITGFGFPTQGKTFLLINFGSYSITLKNESASSTAANRLAINADFELKSGASVMLHYDASSSRWRMVGGGGGSASTPDTTEYKLSVTVVINDLIVAIKDKDGNNPSSGSPVKIKIGDTIRTLSAALSVTLLDGTNWFSFGAADKAAVQQDLFAYLGYNATDGITIGVSPIPYASKYGDFSITNTNETYCKISTTTSAASTDPYVVIGRLAATLSAGAAYTWTVPTFEPDTLRHCREDSTRKLSFTPQWTNLTVGNGTVETYYQRIGNVTKGKIRLVFGTTTSISGSVSVAPPTTHKHSPSGTSYFAIGSISMVDSGVALYMGETVLNAGSFEMRAIGAAGSYANWAYMTSAIPHSWGNTDILEIDFEYFN